MYNLRLVKDGAKVYNDNKGYDELPNSEIIYLKDTIPIQSEWDSEQAAVLLRLTPREWRGIGIGAYFLDIHLDELMRICISLSLAHKASKMSLEDFISGMKEYLEH